MESQKGGSYLSILKSTSLIGSASLLNILISMVRIKFVAVLLGPTGVGLLGLYTQITLWLIPLWERGSAIVVYVKSLRQSAPKTMSGLLAQIIFPQKIGSL